MQSTCILLLPQFRKQWTHQAIIIVTAIEQMPITKSRAIKGAAGSACDLSSHVFFFLEHTSVAMSREESQSHP